MSFVIEDMLSMGIIKTKLKIKLKTLLEKLKKAGQQRRFGGIK